MLTNVFFVISMIVGYCFLTNGQSSSSLSGTNSNVADITRDLTSLRSLLLKANQNIHTLQSQLNLANQNIHTLQNQLSVTNQEFSSLKQETTQCKTSIDELKQNQTRLSVELRNIKSNGIYGTLMTPSNQAVCGCLTEIANIRHDQTQLRDSLKASNYGNVQMKLEISSVKGDVSRIQHNQNNLLQNVSHIWQNVSKTNVKSVMLSKTVHQFYKSEAIIKNNSVVVRNLQNNFVQCRNELTTQQQINAGVYKDLVAMNATIKQQQQQQQQQVIMIRSLSSIANRISGKDNCIYAYILSIEDDKLAFMDRQFYYG